VTAAAHCNQDLTLAGEAHALDHVGGARAAGNDGWSAVDHRIRHRSGGVIARLAGAEGLATERLAELLDRGFS
jgi:hypothetical protein